MDYQYLLFLLILVSLNSNHAQQYYDNSDCLSNQSHPGSTYTCNVSQNSCETFLVYRANRNFETISQISTLLNVTSDTLLRLNNLSSSLDALERNREVLVPIECSCSGQFFRANLSYLVSKTTSLSEISCGVFEGLVKPVTLREENPRRDEVVEAGSMLLVPLKCACPGDLDAGIKYLVTYPFVEGDGTFLVSKKFGIKPDDLWEFNHLDSRPTVYPITTVLVPLRSEPVLHLDNVLGSSPPSPGFLPTTSEEKTTKNSRAMRVFIAGSVLAFSLLLLVLTLCFLYAKALKKWREKKYNSFDNERIISPMLSHSMPRTSSVCLSPDLLNEIKFTLLNYNFDVIKSATNDFHDENKMIGSSTSTCQAYHGVIENAKVMIKETRLEDARGVINVHSKINHINIVKLLGVCYEDNNSEIPWSYLVFEYPENGCLRHCLSNSSSPLPWPQRVRIAFDVATALHYLHCCIFPSYAHMGVHSRNIFVTNNFRAKLGAKSLGETTSEKVDIYAYGIVLLELITGRCDNEEREMKERVGLLGGRGFMDPRLRDEYSLAEALCLAVLAKSCLEDESLNRPSMDDIIKVLSKMVV